MLHRIPMPGRVAATLVAAWLAVHAGITLAAPADDLREAQKLYGQGKVEPAMDKVEAFLRVQPKDPQGRFLKGLLLTEEKKVPEAIQVFTGLTEDYPELPEPYNNLAVLYASQGNYDKAKSALELAIHTHPSYATAHENLGDIYAQLASRAYDRALQLDKNNTSAQVKLAMVKDMFSAQKGTAGQRAPQQPASAVSPAPQATPTPAPAAPRAETKPQVVAKNEPPKPAPAVVAAAPASAPAPAPAPAAAAPGGDDKAAIVTSLEDWARAWSHKDVRGYLAHYAPDFEVPKGASRKSWEKERAERIERPKSIDVAVNVKSVRINGNEATAVVRQSYKSDITKANSTKTMKLEKNGDRWLIKQERSGG